MAWFNRLSPDGAHQVGQRISEHGNEIELDGALIGKGHAPQWWKPDTVLWAEDGGTGLWWQRLDGIRSRLELTRETNGLQANGAGDYVAEHRSPPLGYTFNGMFYASEVTPKLTGLGLLVPESLHWTQTRLRGWILEQQPWLTTAGDTRLILRPEGSWEGYVVAVGPTHNPDMAWRHEAGRFRIVWTTDKGLTQESSYTLSEPRHRLRLPAPPDPPSPPSTWAPKVNVVAYATTYGASRPISVVEWEDTANQQRCRVWIDEGSSLRVEHRNAAGSDTTGRPRPVTIEVPTSGPVIEPIPLPPPPTVDAREWRGNFLANGLEPWGFMYPGWDEDRRARFRAHYRHLGMTHLPFAIWGKYRDEPAFDYRERQDAFRALLLELRADGLVPCVFGVTDQIDDRTWTPSYAIGWLAGWLPGIADLVDLACLGWELNQVAGWTEQGPRGNQRQGHDMIRLAEVMRQALPKARIYAHFQPDWWGPHYSDGIEATWWRDVGDACHGLLMQVQPTAPVPQVLHYCYELPSPHGWPPGVCGRLEALGKDFVLFESARTPERHAQIVAGIPAGRGHGFC